MRRLTDIIVVYAPRLALVALVTLAIPVWLATRARIDNSIEVWLGRSSEAFARYQAFVQRYGSDEMIIIAAAVTEPLEGPAAAAQSELAAALRRVRGIREVVNLPETMASLAMLSPEARRRPQNHALVRNLLLSDDGRTVGVIAWLAPLSGADGRRDVVHRVRAAAADAFVPHGLQPHIVGAPVMNVALDEASSRGARLLLPIAACLATLTLVLLLRSLAAAAACLLAAGATVLWTVAAMVAGGSTLNMVSIALPALLAVLSLSPGIHIASRFLAYPAAAADRGSAMREVLGEVLLPIALTTVTTAAGFASLMVADMQPVLDVGRFAALGLALSLIFNVIFVPGILLRFPVTAARRARSPRTAWLAAVGQLSVRRRGMIVAGSLLLTIAFAAVAAAQVRMESNVLSFFPQDSGIARDYRFVSERLTGLYTLELDMTTPSGNEAAARRALESIAGCLSGRREVARVDHYGVFEPSLRLAAALRAVPLAPPVSGEAIGRLERASLRFRARVDGAVHLRASALIRSMPSRELAALVGLLRERAAALMPANVRWNITGAALLLDESQRALLSTQISSFAIAGLAVLLLIGALFRSWRALVASIVPNVLPVVAMLALMGILRIPMDPATVMIASVAMGLVVDGTIHFLTAYRLAEPRQDGTTAAADALHRSGRPILIATAVASLGFGVLYFAEFRPLAHFGLLTGATLVAAAACDVAVTPAWAAMLGLWKKP